MEEIAIITNYFPPEKGAAANRIEQLALKLDQNNYKVTVICPLANYPEGVLFPQYKRTFFAAEVMQNVQVKRLWIYPSNSKNIFRRIVSTLSFSIGLFFYLAFKKTPKKVVIQSPPLLVSFISVLVLSLKRKKIILNVSDLWPLAALELNAITKGSLSHKISLFLERFIYKNSTLILGQSNEIITHIHSLYPKKHCLLYRNFPDHQIENFELNLIENQPVRLFYAGLLGIAQGVLEVCEKMDLEDLNFEFHIFGDGAEKVQIERYIKDNPKKNIVFHGMLQRSELLSKLATFDIALVPLKKRIYGSVPSKIFEYSALGIPVLYFGGGEGETIVSDNNLGWVAAVANFKNLNAVLVEISKIEKHNIQMMKQQLFEKAKTNFNLDFQIKELIEKEIF